MPTVINDHPAEPTIKQVWLAAFTALLTRLPPAQAAKEADEALEISHQRWSTPRPVKTYVYSHNLPIGTSLQLNLKGPGATTGTGHL
ncbi:MULTISPECIES: hypothetical protein [Luteibacter]|uniref:hypothetical protein n=1 Tax=Luteibacter TaxID=242605 RepID=UPI0005675828|nr:MULTISPECIES: hypothetical protein [unclassified Luteibacter]